MTKYATWIGLGLGWAIAGPIGVVLGMAAGVAVDVLTEGLKNDGEGEDEGVGGKYKRRSSRYKRDNDETTAGDFTVSLLVLSAAVMKADGKILKSELSFVKEFYVSQFGTAEAKRLIPMLKGILKQTYDVRLVSIQIRTNMPHSLRLHLFQYLAGIANADEDLDWSEVNMLRKIASYLNISRRDYEAIIGVKREQKRSSKSRSDQRTSSSSSSSSGSKSESKSRSHAAKSEYTPLSNAYRIMGIDSKATEKEIKKAYRSMVKKYHPDRLVGLTASQKKAGKEQFLKIQEAYERIQKARGIN
jgi:DnaJ like chaperone protein